ncbi:MAG: S-methyl-5'-thioadenosine phosphorylase [Candidatus Aureabacteria bacterium]|nr:S-methyl-5'-thioadenosine phosphorylase [Candidatus Auribacterota bacterium]
MSKRIGVIGGSGLYSLFDNGDVTQKKVDTPYGTPSDAYAIGLISGKEVVFLPRHGKGHRLLPSEVNYRANIYGMKKLGVSEILSISAVGSLQKQYKPRDVVIVDQFFDRTTKRQNTFFGNGFVAHVAFGDPVCPDLRERILSTAKKLKGTFHPKGTYVNMEGPQFSTRAESNTYRSFGFDVIGMTNLTEARLAREAEICYATLAFVTDYDCWHEEEEAVTTDTILKVLQDNAENAKMIIAAVINNMGQTEKKCTCQDALKNSMITRPDEIPEPARTELHEIIRKYIHADE